MREVHYHDWLSNPVMVKKLDDSWRMCADFKDLNKACPKDGYLLPEIDWKVESLCGFPFKCFLDAYKGYHQIQMAKEDEEKTAFITSQGIFCYTKMPFGLRNAGATYQRLSRMEDEIVRDMEETFQTLREINMKLNPKKCTFGIEEGMFLGYKVSTRGLKVCPDKVDAVLSLSSPKCLKDVQKLIGKMGVKNLQENVDSRLVANQVNGTYVAKETDMIRYLEKVNTLTNSFKAFSIKQVPRSENKKVDALSKIASTSFAHLSKQVLVEELKEKSISATEVLAIVEEEGDTWMTHIFKYLTDGTLPAEVKKARAVKRKSWWFSIINGTLYKKSFLGSWLRCVGPLQANYDNPFKDWCEKLCIRQHFASVEHPQTNGLVERANRSLREGIKARLDERSKNWMEELPHVLWGHRTMIKSSNEDTQFSLTYGTEAVIPAEIGMPTLRIAEVDLAQNNEALEINVDRLEERREQAAIREEKSKAKMEKYYSSKVRSTSFKPGDLVYHNNEAIRAEDTRKLGSKWEGPYEVTEALGKGHIS
ncbi:reverse transcriptase domain-containing protein [Tanacetum coccineum]